MMQQEMALEKFRRKTREKASFEPKFSLNSEVESLTVISVVVSPDFLLN